MNFQSFNSYQAEVIGCTTLSFGVNLGVFYSCITETPWSDVDAGPLPKEYECHARRTVTKGLSQDELKRRDVWFVRKDGSNLDDVTDDARRQIEAQALPWFDEFSDIVAALKAFRLKDEAFHGGIGIELLGGRPNSVGRAEIASAIALSLGDTGLAKAIWHGVLEEPFYKGMTDIIELARTER